MSDKDTDNRKPIKDDRGKRLCDYVEEKGDKYLEFKQGRRFDTIRLDSLYKQIEAQNQ